MSFITVRDAFRKETASEQQLLLSSQPMLLFLQRFDLQSNTSAIQLRNNYLGGNL
ncbi:hypothetical protein Q644_18485 [Brucella intermedia 229E]|uniref:Uncharacterized protein n=1 Tax=Brucella intermedia 229E TaxID=1337887 RepID=U4VH06_9HYPH|nr:hypothetical protein Q644_18485 [Brucella intermedia 229E]